MNIEAIKIVKVMVKENASRYAVSQPIYKEDYGLYFLIIEGLELPEVYTVDFSNSETTGTSVPMLGNSDGVLIPQQFIKTGQDIFAFLYITGDGFGRTVYKFKIPNRFRPDRTNEEPEPEEQSLIDQAISALNDAVEQTAQDVLDADASARSAKEDADRAEQARDNAQTYAEQAQTSATASAQSASQAEQAKDTAEVYVGTAKGYAEQADASATASANSALASAQSADRAEQAAGTAGYLDVEIVDGRLIYTRTDAVDVDFTLNNGRLIMEAI